MGAPIDEIIRDSGLSGGRRPLEKAGERLCRTFEF
jgi:hypothetical protein